MFYLLHTFHSRVDVNQVKLLVSFGLFGPKQLVMILLLIFSGVKTVNMRGENSLHASHHQSKHHPPSVIS